MLFLVQSTKTSSAPNLVPQSLARGQSNTLVQDGTKGAFCERHSSITKLKLWPDKLRTGPFVAARWTFVLLNVFCSCWCDFYTLAMEPFLADIATNPELIRGIRPSATSTKGVTVFLLVFIVKSILLNLGRWWSRLCRLCLSHLLMNSNMRRTIMTFGFRLLQKKSSLQKSTDLQTHYEMARQQFVNTHHLCRRLGFRT